MPERLYFDNAATSFPKPPGVFEAMARYATALGATNGRGTYAEAVECGRLIRQCRERLCRLFNGQSSDHVVFTLNTTDALNLAIKGIIGARLAARPRDEVHVVTTAMDHNSVLRPLNALGVRGVRWTCVPADSDTGLVDPDDLRRALDDRTALVVVNHASNVTGTLQPIGAIGRMCAERGVPFLVDAAQSLGHVPVDVQESCIDLLAFPGHKGLLGPLGTGGLYIRPGVERMLATVREGGTGSESDRDTQPETLPDRYEAGSLNAVGIIGLGEALGYLLEHGPAMAAEHERRLMAAFFDAMDERRLHKRLRLLGFPTPQGRVGVFSFVHPTIPSSRIAEDLERKHGVLVRAGLHCAPRAHASLGTAGGAVRLSLGPFISAEDIRHAVAALDDVCRGRGLRKKADAVA
jgi:cysteine desulfurase/selenocysteine lyase